MKLHRNPVLAGLALATLLLAGCGISPQTAIRANATAQGAAQVMSTAQADALVERIERGTVEANKDWQLVEGTVSKLLPDDLNGSRHQHFLFKTAEGKTVKIAHNIDLAPYVPVKVGDHVKVKCEYIRSKPYDVAHWTHFDPAGGEGGYIELNGKKYDRAENPITNH